MIRDSKTSRSGTGELCKPHVEWSIAIFYAAADLKRSCRRWRLEVRECQGREPVVEERHGVSSLTARNSVERLVASVIRNREDPRFLGTVYIASPPFFIYYSVVCWFKSVALVLL